MPKDACIAPAQGDRHILEASLRIKKVGSGCEGIGGFPVIVTAGGQLYARSIWQDTGGVFVAEIWKGQWEQLVTAEYPRNGNHCVEATAAVDPGLWVIRTCHAAWSNPQPGLEFVPLELTIIYP